MSPRMSEPDKSEGIEGLSVAPGVVDIPPGGGSMVRMLWVRGLIYGFPVVIAALFVTSYLGSQSLQRLPRNELLLGSGGEAKNLNPILSTTTADSRVAAFVFNGLLTFNGDIELTGDLAESWDMRQITTVFCEDEQAAARAADRLRGEAADEGNAAWRVESVTTAGSEVRVRLGLPGERVPEQLLGVLDPAWVAPLTILRVTVDGAARESSRHFLEITDRAGSVVRRHVESSDAYVLTVVGDPAPVRAELEAYYEANSDAAGEVAEAGTARVLNEPRIIFHLRDDVHWHDGEPFTSADAAFTYRMIMDETVASPRRPDFELVSDVETPDPHTFIVNYRKPYSSALMSWSIGMLPEHILAGQSTTWWARNYNRDPVGTGPFRFSEWRSNEFIRLDRNADYFEGAPHLDRIAIRTIPDQVALRLSFVTRQIDIWTVDDHAVSRFREDPRFELFASPRPAYEYIGWNLRRPLFRDRAVRRALAHAVDVDAIIKYIIYGYGTRSTGPFVPQTWYYNDSIRPIPYDPGRARELLAEAGWTPGPDGILEKDGERFSFTLVCPQGNETRKDIATLVQSDLRGIGIEVDIGIYEWTVFIKKVVQDLDFDAMVLGWSLGYDYDQYQLWHSSQDGPGLLNTGAYSNPEVDHLLDEIRTEFDRGRIKELCGRMQRIIYEDQPYLFLYVPETIGAMWRDAFRVRRPDDDGWREEPVRATNAGFTHYMQWWYRAGFDPDIRVE